MSVEALAIVLATVLTPVLGGIVFVLFKLRDGMSDLGDRISKLEGFKDGLLITQQSPLALTETGEKVLEESGGKEYLEDHKDRLIAEFSKTKNAFDIQEKARDVVRQEMERDAFEKIKEYLFREGKSARDIELVMGLQLRNMVLESRGIPIQQSDSEKVSA